MDSQSFFFFASSSGDEKKSLLVIYELRVEPGNFFVAPSTPTFRANIIRTLEIAMEQGREKGNWAKALFIFSKENFENVRTEVYFDTFWS